MNFSYKKMKKVIFGMMNLIKSMYCEYFFLLVFQCILVAMQSILNTVLISILLQLLNQNISDFVKVSILLSLASMTLGIVTKFTSGKIKVQQVKLKEKILHLIFLKNTKVSYEKFETPKFHALAESARFSAINESCIEMALTNSMSVLQAIFVLGSIVTITVLFDLKLTVVLCCAAFINIIIMKRFSKIRAEYWREQISVDRGYVYYIEELQKVSNAKDFRMYSVGKLLQTKFQNFAKDLVDGIREIKTEEASVQSALQLVGCIETILIYLIILMRTNEESVSPATITFLAAAALQFSTAMTLLISSFMKLITGIERTEPLIDLILVSEKKENGKNNFKGNTFSIEVKDVCFSYPGSSTLSLDHVNFSIRSGEIVSFVGLNGAGKTTLIKLLCRFYRPTSGDILVNGVSIYDYRMNEYLDQISAIFQDFALFPISIKDNISYAETEMEIGQILKKLGLEKNVAEWPEGVNSRYGKTFSSENIELSGGQKQKIALARALIRKSKLLLLDEPTSALDPLAEAEFYESLLKEVNGRTTIFISHRMSSSIFSNKIIVFKNGRVDDQGTHEELMKKRDGLYYELFMQQAKGYKQ